MGTDAQGNLWPVPKVQKGKDVGETDPIADPRQSDLENFIAPTIKGATQ